MSRILRPLHQGEPAAVAEWRPQLGAPAPVSRTRPAPSPHAQICATAPHATPLEPPPFPVHATSIAPNVDQLLPRPRQARDAAICALDADLARP
jgi:hypothetical protein